jgi:hypothetical protein
MEAYFLFDTETSAVVGVGFVDECHEVTFHPALAALAN